MLRIHTLVALVFAFLSQTAAAAEFHAYLYCEVYQTDQDPSKEHPSVRLFSDVYNQTALETADAKMAARPNFLTYLKSAYPQYVYPHKPNETCVFREAHRKGEFTTPAELEAYRLVEISDAKRQHKLVEDTDWTPN